MEGTQVTTAQELLTTPDQSEMMRIIPGLTVQSNGWSVHGARHALEAGAAQARMDVMVKKLGPPIASKLIITDHSNYLPKYQREGIGFAKATFMDGCLIHDDMGLGKTVQAIAAVHNQSTVKLVLCSAYMRPQWAAEIQKWTEKLGLEPRPVFVLPPAAERATAKRQARLAKLAVGDWLIAFYRDAEAAMKLIGYKPFTIIVDEAHNLRGLGTKQVDQVQGASTFAAGRIALTGSALVNDVAKLFPVLNMVQPGGFGNYWSFTERYASARRGEYGWQTGDSSNMAELRQRMQHCSIRRIKSDVADQMPFDTKYTTVWLDVGPSAFKALESFNVRGVSASTYASVIADAKRPAIVEAVASDRAALLPGIVFTFLKSQARKLAQDIPDALAIDGDVDPMERKTRIDRYVAEMMALKKVPTLCATIDSVGEGLNMQWAKVVSFGALDLTPDRLRQGIGRAARMGQTGTVTVRFFVARGTSDEWAIETVAKKLREQESFAGRAEEEKTKMGKALSPAGERVEDVLRAMWQRYQDNPDMDIESPLPLAVGLGSLE